MIKIHSQSHFTNTGFGNKLLLSCFAECYAIETKQELFNWLATDVLRGGRYDDSVLTHDNQNIAWRHLDIDTHDEFSLVGCGTVLSSCEFHQSASDIELIKKHKDRVVKDFGCREGVFVHVRTKGLRSDMIPDIEYYKKCLPPYCSGYISGDDPQHDTVKRLLDDFDLKLYEESPEKTIIFGSRFENKVLSLGTFSWWIGFIGNQNNVLCPNPNKYTRWHGPIFDCMKWKRI
jgi:hypothetical protein